MSKKNEHAVHWLVLAVASSVGAISSFIQTVERIKFADQPQNPLTCDLNSVFSCSSVFDAWQSSVFGFSNSILCLLFFGVMLGVALAGLFGSAMNRTFRLVMQFFALFFLGFGAWYLWSSAFVIGALCIFCIFCYSGVIAMNWAWLRINADDLPLSDSKKAALKRGMTNGADTFGWLLYALVFVFMFLYAFA